MKKLKAVQGEWWGREYSVNPYLLDYVHVDGKQCIWFENMDDRPNFYVVKIDSGVNLDEDMDELCGEIT